MPLSIRSAAAGDAEAIAAIGRASFTHAYQHLFTSEVLSRYLDETYSVPAIAQSLGQEGNRYFVAEHPEGIVGFLKLKADDPHPAVDSRHPWQVQKLYVDPAEVGHGIGGQLMVVGEGAMQQAGADVAWLDVMSDNQGAMRFYERLGYRNVGEEMQDFEGLSIAFCIFEKRY